MTFPPGPMDKNRQWLGYGHRQHAGKGRGADPLERQLCSEEQATVERQKKHGGCRVFLWDFYGVYPVYPPKNGDFKRENDDESLG